MQYLKNKWGQAKQAMAEEASGKQPREVASVAPGGGLLQGTEGFKPQGQGGFRAQAYGGTQQGDDPNRKIMRDEYGWKMTDRGFDALQKDASKFNTAVSKYKTKATREIASAKAKGQKQISGLQSQYAGQKSAFDKQVATATSQLSRARKDLGGTPTPESLISKYIKDSKKIKFGVVSGSKLEHIYTVPQKLFNEWAKNSGFKMTYGKGRVIVDVKQGGRIHGNALHNLGINLTSKKYLTQAFKDSPDFKPQYGKAVSAYNSARNKLNAAESNFNKQRSASQSALHKFNTNINLSKQNLKHSIKTSEMFRDTEVDKVTAARQAKIDAAREGHAKKSAAAKSAYAGLAKTIAKG